MFGKWRGSESQVKKLEAMGYELDHITGRHCIGGHALPGGDEDVVRFDFDGDIHPSVNDEMQQRGFISRTFGNSLWLKKR